MYRHETLEKYVKDAMGTPVLDGGSVTALSWCFSNNHVLNVGKFDRWQGRI